MSTDRLAIVTGTSSGIGLATARLLLDGGWIVVGLSRRAAPFRESGYRHERVDLGDLSQAKTAAHRTLPELIHSQVWARVGLVNNAAAAGVLCAVEDADASEFANICTVNLVSPVLLMGALMRQASKESSLRIVNVSTGAAVRAFPGLVEYGSTKAGLRMASMVAAAELGSSERPAGAHRDFAVLSYQPGIVDTPMQDSARTPGRPWNRLFLDFREQGRLVPPEAPAREIVEFLDSDGHPPFSERRYGS